MTNYSELVKAVNIPELVKALRHCMTKGDLITICDGCPYKAKIGVDCENNLHKDAASAIEELDAEETRLLLLTSDLQDKLMDAQAEVNRLELDNEDYEHEHRRLKGEIEALQAEQKKTVTQIFGEEQMAWEGRCKDLMKQISELQAEVERLKDSNEELREKQTFIDHYGAEWITSAKDVPTAAYEHGYADGLAEVKAQLPRRGRWIIHGEPPMLVIECSVCGQKYFNHVMQEKAKYCSMCGAKMEVQE